MRRISKIFLFCLILSVSFSQFAAAQQSKADSKETAARSVININTATTADLEKLPGVGPSLAKRIVDFRQKNGAFKNPADLMAVQGIGEKKYEQLKNLISVK